ncbi:MAG TPA: hypothetical protein VFY39_13260, partial [Gammaproteobacteria bacterium]|nr:hypothetical protein [Gammaproteobacteria bacterium]
RAEGLPLLVEKFRRNAAVRLPAARVADIEALFADLPRLEVMAADDFIGLFLPAAEGADG